MKFLIKNLLFVLAVLLVITSCKKVENKVVFEGGTPPVLTASIGNGGTVPLLIANKNKSALDLTWTNPDYMFNTGVSSQDVTYTIQLDKAGANFSSPELQEKSVSKDLSYTLTVGEINTMLTKLGYPEDQEGMFEIRLKSSLGDNAVALYSNVLTYKTTPYLDVAIPLPIGGNLYLVGDATPGGWSNPVPEPSQKFTKISSTAYEITVNLTGGKHYLAIPVNGSWDHKFAVSDNSVADLWKGGDFIADSGQDIPGPPQTGNYKIVFEFKTGKFSVTKL